MFRYRTFAQWMLIRWDAQPYRTSLMAFAMLICGTFVCMPVALAAQQFLGPAGFLLIAILALLVFPYFIICYLLTFAGELRLVRRWVPLTSWAIGQAYGEVARIARQQRRAPLD